MVFHPHTIAIIATHKCTAACDHCCFSCSPKVDDAIPVSKIYEILNQAANIKSIKVVVFTGGEVFLLGDDLPKLVKHANNLNLHVRIVTNGYWATNDAVATKKITLLKEAGLNDLNLSTGEMHAEYVDPENVKRAAVISARMGLHTVVMVEVFQKANFDMDKFLGDGEFSRLASEGEINLLPSPWMEFSGKSTVKHVPSYNKHIEKNASGGCSTVMNVVAICPKQSVVACCGLPMEIIPELHLGNLKSNTLREVIDRAPNDFFKIWMHIEGPDGIMKFLSSLDPALSFPENTVHICDKCRFLYQNPSVKNLLTEHLPPNRNEIVSAFMSGQLIKHQTKTDRVDIDVFKAICNSKRASNLFNMAVQETDTKPVLAEV